MSELLPDGTLRGTGAQDYAGLPVERRPPEKAMLPAGEWDNEPDYHEWDVDGIKCILTRGPFWSWNGYIGIPIGNILFHADEEELYENGLRLHCGITYGPSRKVPGRPGITPYWWVGFDTAHNGDHAPGLFMIRQYIDAFEAVAKETGKTGKELREIVFKRIQQGKIPEPYRFGLGEGDHYRNFEYCKEILQTSAEALAKGTVK